MPIAPLVDTAAPERIACDALAATVCDIFVAAGVAHAEAACVAADLVQADREGLASHGVMLVPMYVDRLLAGSVAVHADPVIDSAADGVARWDARDALGQPVARRAVTAAVEQAARHGMGAVAIRNAFHFGAAGIYARAIARHCMVGLVFSNTRPLMPAPGGRDAVVGNNPIAIAVPTASGEPVCLDMAMSATAMGRIRLAAADGEPIPAGWATDAAGLPTTDPAAAIKGLLLPAAGPKGFGLAFMIDLLCAGLSGGAGGPGVQPLYGDPAVPYRCSQLFLAIDVAHFGPVAAFSDRVSAAADAIRAGTAVEAGGRLFAPGDPALAAAARNDRGIDLAPATRAALAAVSQRLGIVIPYWIHDKGVS